MLEGKITFSLMVHVCNSLEDHIKKLFSEVKDVDCDFNTDTRSEKKVQKLLLRWCPFKRYTFVPKECLYLKATYQTYILEAF